MKYATLRDIARISKRGFDTVVNTVANKFGKESSIRKLLNTHQKLLRNKDLTPEQRLEAEKLSAEIIRLLASLPKGEIPQWLHQAIGEATNAQNTFTYKDVLYGVLEDGLSDPTNALNSYVTYLKGLDIWQGYDPRPVTTSEFYQANTEWLSKDTVNDPDLEHMQAYVSKELSYLRDMVKLNELAKEKADPAFTELVEELNGLVMTRLEQKEYAKVSISGKDMEHIAASVKDHLVQLGYVPRTREFANKFQELYDQQIDALRKRVEQPMPDWADTRESWGTTVRETPEDIRRKLLKEGFVKGTDAYKEEFAKRIRARGRTEVDPTINRMGKRNDYEVGEVRTDALDRGEIELSGGSYAGGDTTYGVREDTTKLMVNEPEAELLPRGFNAVTTDSAYKNPTVDNLKRLRKVLSTSVTRKAAELQKRSAKVEGEYNLRLAKVVNAMEKWPRQTTARAVSSGELQNILDVIVAAQTIARTRKAIEVNTPEVEEPPTPTKTSTQNKAAPKKKAPKPAPIPIEVTEETIEYLNPSIHQETPISDEQLALLERDVLRGHEEVKRDAAEKVAEAITDFVGKGDDDAYQKAMKPKHKLDRLGRLLASWTKDLGEKFLTSKLTSLRYVGATLLETGAGFGGGARRKATAALIRDQVYKQSVSPMVVGYRDNLEKFAASEGAGALGKLNALESAGINSGITDRFNKAVFKEIEARKQGQNIPAQPGVKEFVDVWRKYMDANHESLVNAGIKGFTKQRKVEHYMPHVWKPSQLTAMVNKHGVEKVHNVLTQGYMTSNKADGLKLTKAQAEEQAWNLIEWIEGQKYLEIREANGMEDPYLPVMDSRARSRAEINTTAEIDGLSVLDLLDTDVIGNGVRYSNRVAGWVGVSRATNGTLTSHMEIAALKSHIQAEAAEKGEDAVKLGQLFDDSIEMLFGRPARGGLAPELRMLKDMTALTRMGGLGTAQLIETGQVITRSMLNLFSDPATVAKVRKMAQTPVSEDALMQEIQSLTGIRDDLEFLERQSIHLDQEQLDVVSEVRKASLWAADKMTLGGLKAPASRLLGKTTGYNMIRRYQSRLNQASFTMDVANHFKHGKGKMGNARMADLGLTDVDGTDVDLQEVFTTLVEYNADGTVKKLNADKWPEVAREKFSLAMLRDDAQNIQRTHVGELPPWMNSPLMGLLFQFREMPMVAMNKSLRRSMAFADKEAVVATMMNAAFAGLVRWSKFAVLGYTAAKITDSEWKEPTGEQMDAAKYITQFGLYADAYDLILDGTEAVNDRDVDKVLNQIPVLGLMQDYFDATGITEPQRRTQLDAVQGLTPLGNTAYGDAIYLWMNENFGE